VRKEMGAGLQVPLRSKSVELDEREMRTGFFGDDELPVFAQRRM
jgi:hypothetical protein